MMTYNYCSGYSLISYMEYPVLLVQNYVLIVLVLHYKRQLKQHVFLTAGAYFVITMLVMRLIPAALLAPFVVLFVFSHELNDSFKCVYLYWFAAALHPDRCSGQGDGYGGDFPS